MVRSVEGDSQSWQGNDTVPPTTDRDQHVISSLRNGVDDDLTVRVFGLGHRDRMY